MRNLFENDGDLSNYLSARVQTPVVAEDGAMIEYMEDLMDTCKEWIEDYDVDVRVPGAYEQAMSDFDDYLETFKSLHDALESRGA